MISWGEGECFHHNKFGRKEQYYKSIFLRQFESYGNNIKQASDFGQPQVKHDAGLHLDVGRSPNLIVLLKILSLKITETITRPSLDWFFSINNVPPYWKVLPSNFQT